MSRKSRMWWQGPGIYCGYEPDAAIRYVHEQEGSLMCGMKEGYKEKCSKNSPDLNGNTEGKVAGGFKVTREQRTENDENGGGSDQGFGDVEGHIDHGAEGCITGLAPYAFEVPFWIQDTHGVGDWLRQAWRFFGHLWYGGRRRDIELSLHSAFGADDIPASIFRVKLEMDRTVIAVAFSEHRGALSRR